MKTHVAQHNHHVGADVARYGNEVRRVTDPDMLTVVDTLRSGKLELQEGYRAEVL